MPHRSRNTLASSIETEPTARFRSDPVSERNPAVEDARAGGETTGNKIGDVIVDAADNVRRASSNPCRAATVIVC